MFRLACFQGLMQSHGKDYGAWSMLAGRKLGQHMQIPNYASIDKAFRAMKLGRVKYTEEGNTVVFEVEECLVCDGIMGIDEPCCGFVGGLLGSVVQRVTDRDVVIRETQCIGRHHSACRFEISFTRSAVAEG